MDPEDTTRDVLQEEFDLALERHVDANHARQTGDSSTVSEGEVQAYLQQCQTIKRIAERIGVSLGDSDLSEESLREKYEDRGTPGA